MRSNGAKTPAKRTQKPLLTLRNLEATETRTGRDTKIRAVQGCLPYLFLLLGVSKWPHSRITCNATCKGQKGDKSRSAQSSFILLQLCRCSDFPYCIHVYSIQTPLFSFQMPFMIAHPCTAKTTKSLESTNCPKTTSWELLSSMYV